MTSGENVRRWEPRKMVTSNRRHLAIGAATLLFAAIGLPSPCFASISPSIMSRITSPNDAKAALVSILDGLSQSGAKGMAIYTLSFVLWTMTVGVTTPVETAAGMSFPLRQAVPLSAIGKIGGALLQYALAKYLFSRHARRKMEGSEWMGKIDASFRSRPFRSALVWRFSPLPEFVKNVGPALVPALRTRCQALAIVTHGLPFTVLWSCMGGEAARVARGGRASPALKWTAAAISWVGLVVSPTLFGWWIKGLGEEDSTKGEDSDAS